MNNLNNYYNSLFAIEFTVLSILITGIFLFLQIIHESNLYKFAKNISKIKLSIVILIALISLLVSGLGMLFTSLDYFDFIPSYDFSAKLRFNSSNFALFTLLLFFVSTFLTIYFAVQEILSLRPDRLIKKIMGLISGNKIQNYLIYRYGLEEPFFVNIDFIIKDEKAASNPKKDDDLEAYKNDLSFYNQVMKRVNKEDDPLEPIGELAIKAIRDRDKSLLDKSLNAFQMLFEKDIYLKYHTKSNWDPNDKLLEKFTEYLLQWAKVFVEECRKEETSKLLFEVYEFTKQIGLFVKAKNEYKALEKMLSYWKIETDKNLSGDTSSCIQLINIQNDFGRSAFENIDDEFNKHVAESVFQNFGWLAERIIEKNGIEKTPMMYDSAYQSTYDELFNALFGYDWIYKTEYSKQYPLMYFDAIWVLFLGLLNELSKNKNEQVRNRISEHIFDCAYVFSSFAIAAINQGENGDGASLATLKLINVYNKLRESEQFDYVDKMTDNVIELIVNVGFASSGKPLSSVRSQFLGSIETKTLELLQNIPPQFKSRFQTKILDNYLKFGENRNYDAVRNFIKKLGESHNTDFGLKL